MENVNPPVTVTFWGATQMVTGSMHLVEIGAYRLLLDCGLTFGNRPETRLHNSYFPFPPQDIDAVILTHAHVDHCGNLPNLVRQGFTGPVYCTPPTRDLLALMLADSAKIQQEEGQTKPGVDVGAEVGRLGPLYTKPDVANTLAQCHAVPYEMPVEIQPGVRLRFVDAGHVLGSAMVHLTLPGVDGERSLTFTGDLGRQGLPFLNDPADIPPADLLICESTYGGRTHPPLADLADSLAEVVSRTVERGGKVLIPAFSLGRAQVVVYYLQQWMQQERMPRVPIFVDSPLACDIVKVYQRHPEYLAEETLGWLEPEANGHGRPVQYVRSREESRQLSTRREPCIIVASGGMCEAGRILHHLQHNIDDPRSTVVLVSYQAPQSLGQRLREPGPTIRFDGKKWNKWAEVVELSGFSGHADHNDFMALLRPLAGRTEQVRLVHGDTEQAETLAKALLAHGFEDVAIPRRGDVVTLTD